ncbi:hypothetical protein BOX15_Mlig030990g1 [Macrostomum lignano]|uniref:GB1/RHD3-type G domain-containing protein n=2 Tax=Macrostomum lignano TaxID=282301 RepID=A0A1I8HLT7_9PLAT|nr:hypothetical protein BOX15_Mlig030990g1 [Macrostomum lignano]
MNESKHRPNGEYGYHYHAPTSSRTNFRKEQNASLTKSTESFNRASGQNQRQNTRINNAGNRTIQGSDESVTGMASGQGQDWSNSSKKGPWNKQYSPNIDTIGLNPTMDTKKEKPSSSNKEMQSVAKYIVKKRDQHKEASPSGQLAQQYKDESPGPEPAATAGGEAEWPSLQQPQRLSRPARSVATASAPVSTASPTRLAHLQELPLPPAPLTLVTPSGKFVDEAQRQEFQEYLDPTNTNFSVVGVLGLQSSGKSSLLNSLLLGRLPGQEEPPAGRAFAVESLDNLLGNAHRTRGVQLQTTPERAFLLDCEALLALSSAEALIQAAASERRGGGNSGAGSTGANAGQSDFITVETGATMHGIQLSAFLMSACHLLLVVADGWPDPDLLRLLLAADMLRPAVLDDTGFQPRVIFVLNRTPADAGPAPARLRELLAGLFEGAAFRLDAGSVFCLPLLDEDCPDSAAAIEYTEELERLRKLILTSPRHHMLRQDLFNEKVWLDFAAEVWENIEKSVMLAEYHRLIG